MQLQERSCKGQIWLTEVTQSENSESRDRFAKQSGKNVLDSWHINTKTERCGRLSVLHSTCEGGYVTQPLRYVYIYRPLRVIWPLSAKKTKAPKSPNQSSFIFL